MTSAAGRYNERYLGWTRGDTGAQVLSVYAVVGLVFGFVLVRAEVISWFRIQEMFRFQSFHMYGILASAILTSAVGLALIRRFRHVALSGDQIAMPPKQLGTGRRYWLGGTIFGLGWGITGACPGPMFALLGTGIGVFAVVIAAAVAGTWTYGMLRDRLPH